MRIASSEDIFDGVPYIVESCQKQLKVISKEVVFYHVPLDVGYYQSGRGSFQAKQSSMGFSSLQKSIITELEAVTSVVVFEQDGIL